MLVSDREKHRILWTFKEEFPNPPVRGEKMGIIEKKEKVRKGF